jgi:hypothetical protein
MDLYTLDDERNATRDHRPGGGGTSVLRPVNVRPVTIAQPAAAATVAAPAGYAQPGYAQPGYAQPGYMQPGYMQPGYMQPGYMQPGYMPGPGYAPPGFPPAGYAPAWGNGRSWGQPWGWNGPNGPVYYGTSWGGAWGSGMGTSNIGQTLASGLGSLIEIGTGLVAAFQSLPVAPNADESTVLANVTDYQRRLAEHAKGDERLRTIGSAGGKVVDLAVRLFSNPSGGSFMAPRGWY